MKHVRHIRLNQRDLPTMYRKKSNSDDIIRVEGVKAIMVGEELLVKGDRSSRLAHAYADDDYGNDFYELVSSNDKLFSRNRKAIKSC